MTVYILAETNGFDVLGIIGVYPTWAAAQATGQDHRERANKLFADGMPTDPFQYRIFEAPFDKRPFVGETV